MDLTEEHFFGASERLGDALAVLQKQAGAGAEALGYFGDIARELHSIGSWLRRPAQVREWPQHIMPPVYGLLFAQAWELAFPDLTPPAFPDGAERTEAGWTVHRATVWFGDTHVPGWLDLKAPLIVIGHLSVEGLLDDGDASESYLAVAGDVRARAIHSAADHLVLGTLSAEVVFCTGSDGVLVTGGDVMADLFVPAEHAYAHYGKLRAGVVGAGDRADVVAERLAPWLPSGYVRLGVPGTPVDRWRVLQEAAVGRSPVLAQPRPVVFPPPALLLSALAAPAAVTELDLSGSRLHRVPEDISALTALTRLDLEQTPLTGLDGIGGLRTLEHLSIRNTPVRSLAPLQSLKDLRHLDVSYCEDVQDWAVLLDLPALDTLVAHGCALPPQVRAQLLTRLGERIIGQGPLPA
ncbi:leucine-rich repeat domain-containing protein [Streptosporangium longisporum]|uniref:leucine-rich repeat domain-containing protein n=1 Tax=Streptosporangium longisporum TaxID=46187 RepID=UPI0039A673B6